MNIQKDLSSKLRNRITKRKERSYGMRKPHHLLERSCDLLVKMMPFSRGHLRLDIEKPAERKLHTAGVVGVSGLEPEASWSRTKRDTKLRHTPT